MASELEPIASDHDMTLRHGTRGERAYEFDKHRQWLRKWSDERAYVELGSFHSIIGSRLGRCDGKAPNAGRRIASVRFPITDRPLSVDVGRFCGSFQAAASSFVSSAAMAAYVLERLKRRLLVSAAGRNLAIDLAVTHGADAPDKLEALIALGSPDGCKMDVLMKARQELGKIRLD